MQHFVDEAFITVSSGNGGPGCVSFRREANEPFGGPDGGDGGNGGSVIFHVKSNIRTLYDIKRKRKFAAQNGQSGMGAQRYGKKGEDVIVEVPPGTMIYTLDGDELLKDLTAEDEYFELLTGGKGGKGNMHFATSTNQAPRYAQPGLPGQKLEIKLELKLIADVGLVGFPNAGKSTLLSVITNAKPKIASYPFTTLIPNLGVFSVDYETFVIADIPGIIEGAHDGVGLGIEFLKHIERTKLLLIMIDLEDPDFDTQFDKLRVELESYSKKLAEKPFLIAATKTDLEDSDIQLEILQEQLKTDIIPISSITRKGLRELMYKLKDAIHRIEQDGKDLAKW